jgi:nitrilase
MPRVAIALRPPANEPGIFCAEIDLERVGQARRSLDAVGHYSRPDLLQLHVSTAPLRPVEFKGP